jgi:hypothetical protein
LHNEEFHNLYSPNIERMINSRRVGHAAHGGNEKCIQNIGFKPEGKRPLRSLRGGWEDNIELEKEMFGSVGGLIL